MDVEIEIWKDIEDYEGLYQVSTFGRVINSKGHILKPMLQNTGYLIVHLYKNTIRRAFTIHRMVAKTFIPMVEGKDFVNHKKRNKD